MANIIYPLINPLRFYPVNPTVVPQYNWKYLDMYEFTQTVPYFQEPSEYFQPWQTTDRVRLQFQSDFGPFHLKLVDLYGNIIDSLPFVQKQQNTQDPTLFIYEIDVDLSKYSEGVYRWWLAVDNNPDILFQTNPQDICVYHANTLYLEYKHSSYHAGVVFETGFSPSIRIEGAIPYKSPASKDSLYEDQTLNETLLYSVRYSVYELIVGDSFGIPDYLIHLIDMVQSCDTVLYDGRQLVKADGSSWSAADQELYPLRGWTRDMRESVNRDSLIWQNGAIVQKKAGFIISVDARGFRANQGGTTYSIQDVE